MCSLQASANCNYCYISKCMYILVIYIYVYVIKQLAKYACGMWNTRILLLAAIAFGVVIEALANLQQLPTKFDTQRNSVQRLWHQLYRQKAQVEVEADDASASAFAFAKLPITNNATNLCCLLFQIIIISSIAFFSRYFLTIKHLYLF